MKTIKGSALLGVHSNHSDHSRHVTTSSSPPIQAVSRSFQGSLRRRFPTPRVVSAVEEAAAGGSEGVFNAVSNSRFAMATTEIFDMVSVMFEGGCCVSFL